MRSILERLARAFGARDHLATVENAIQSLGDGVVLYGPDDRVVWVNRRFRELHARIPLAYRIGAHYSDILHAAVASGEVPMPAEGVEAWVARRLEERRRSEQSYTLLLHDGRWLRITDRRTQDGSLVSIHSDVTELKNAEAAAEHARAGLVLQTEVLSTLVENVPIGVTLVDPDGRFIAFNRAYLAVNDIPPEIVKPGDRFEDSIRYLVQRGDFGTDEDGETIVSRVVTEARKREPQHYERVRGLSGRVVEIHRAPLPSGGFVTAYVDVTEARRREADVASARAQLERQTEVLTTLTENLKVGVSLVDPEGRFMALNSAYLDLFGIPPGTFSVGDTYEACIRYMIEHGDHDIGDEDIETALRRIVDNAMRPVPQKFERKRRNGRTIEIRRAPLPGGGFVTTYIDETDARQREADLILIRAELEAKAAELAATARNLHAANAAKSMFLANMSHELRTPLNAILGFSEIMRDAMLGPLDQRYRGYANDIHLSGAYLLRLINDILDTSKIDAGQMHLEQNRIDLAELIGECQRLVLERARTAGVSLVCAIGRSFPPLAGDRLRLKQALLNLLVNAVKFTPAGGSVRVSASAARPHGIDIAIADTGIGMEPASVARALEPFQQLDNRLARRYEGTGLGLPLAKSLIELHGGKLTIESAAGKGTTARIWLPPERLLDETTVARNARRAGKA